ncbi:MAG TPA: diaminopimelate epimerase [Chitinophagaceae bacterium]|jgi:diaminopimelate epimerase|nr:diaminopimelate epimerase [Chitinophagaceae bacterium]
MHLHFYKYQGTGNDFIILDNRDERYNDLTEAQVKALCHRRFGIGADGLMLLNNHESYDFQMVYFNADGRESSMCGNGGRCLVKFAADLGILKSTYTFLAVDGVHEAEIDPDGIVSLKMNDVTEVRAAAHYFTLNTGSPHYVELAEGVMTMDVFAKGRSIRNSPPFAQEGINVNFVEQKEPDSIIVRTYERGVEDETMSCGTGVTAAALVCYHNENGYNHVAVQTLGGDLSVEYDRLEETYRNVWLNGPAVRVFEGTIPV